MFQNHFNIKRFYNALRYDLRLNAKSYITFCISFFVVLLLFDFFFIIKESNKFNESNYLQAFYFAFVIGIIIVVGTSFPSFRHKRSTINYLMLPASTFEKFLIQFLTRILSFMILFLPIFWLEFKLADAIYNLFEWKWLVKIDSFNLLTPFKLEGINEFDIFAILGALLSIAAFLFAGVTFFKKKALPKTILSFALFVLLIYIFFMLGTLMFFPKKFDIIKQPVFIETYRVYKDLFNIQIFFYVMGIVPSLFLLPLAYFKLKEKEL